MKILVIRFSSMGDVILASAVLNYLVRRYPGVEIGFLTAAAWADFFAGDSRIGRLYRYPADVGAGGTLDIKEWDLIVDLQNSPRSRRVTAEAPVVTPVSRFEKLHLQRAALLLCRIDRYDRADTVLRRYATAAGWCPEQGEMPLPSIRSSGELSAAARSVWERPDTDCPVLALLPFCAWRNKAWPLDRFVEIGRHFLRKGWRVSVFGGPADRIDAENMVRLIGGNSSSFAGIVRLDEIAVLLSRSALALGNDTGLSHLARAVGVRTAMIFGATTRHFGFFPQGAPAFRVIEEPVLCRPCHAHGGDLCWRISRPCLGRIGVQRVVTELDALGAEPKAV